MKKIGPTFGDEIRVAGLAGLPFSWGDDGVIQFDPRMTPAQIAAVQAVYAAHDPLTPAPLPPPNPLIAKIDAAVLSPIPQVLKDLLVAWKAQL